MLKVFRSSFVVGFLLGLVNVLPVRAAEKLILTYGSLKISMPVASLKTYAETGQTDESLSPYLNMLSQSNRDQLRALLTKQIPIDPVRTSRFLNSAMGEDVLYRMGKAITIEGNINGKYAIRSAIVQSAFAPGGFTFLGFLEKYPTNLELPGEYVLDLTNEIAIAIDGTKTFVTKMRQWTLEEAKEENNTVDYDKKGDLESMGKFEVKQETWHLEDVNRNRKFYVLVFKPTTYREGLTPVIIFSHGLASRPDDFVARAKHLASYGFVVAMPQHPGSDLQYMQDMFAGYHANIFDVNEFIDRPLDISYVIDELERRNQSEFAGKLDLKRVGAYGHSFGGYTVLSLAGARINFDQLNQSCNNDKFAMFNAASILQCRALALPHQSRDFRDERVVAVIAANPVNRALFGRQEISRIKIPVLIISGSYDPATPPVFEQVGSFNALKSSKKYLLLAEGQAHVDLSVLDGGITSSVESIGDIQLPNPSNLHKYFDSIALAFGEVHVAQNQAYLPYLESAYAVFLSKGNEFKLNLIDQNYAKELNKEIIDFQQKYNMKPW